MSHSDKNSNFPPRGANRTHLSYEASKSIVDSAISNTDDNKTLADRYSELARRISSQSKPKIEEQEAKRIIVDYNEFLENKFKKQALIAKAKELSERYSKKSK